MKRLVGILLVLVLLSGIALPVAAVVTIGDTERNSINTVLQNYNIQVPPEYSYVAVVCRYQGSYYATRPIIYYYYSKKPIIYDGDEVYLVVGEINPSLKYASFGETTARFGYNSTSREITLGYGTFNSGIFRYYLVDRSTATIGGLSELMQQSGKDVIAYMDGVPVLPDTSALQALLNQAASLTESDYTPATWSILQNAVTDANAMLAAGGYTIQQVNDMTNRLQAALDGLEAAPVAPTLPDTTELEETLVEAKAIDDIGYTPFTWTRLQTAIVNGDNLLAQPTYTQVQVTTATRNLRTGIDGLQFMSSGGNGGSGSGGHRYLVDGLRFEDLSPSLDFIMQNIAEGRKFGLFLFFVIVTLAAVLRILKRLLHIDDFRNDDMAGR